MEVKELIKLYHEKRQDGHFFDKDTLEFFGESISDMKVTGIEKVTSLAGVEHTCYVLRRLQKKHPLGPTWSNAYFDVETMEDICV